MNRLDTGAVAMPVIRAEAHRLRMALKRPYDNALGRLDAFDVIVVALDDGVGRVGWGEACPVAGYSPESPDEAWAYTGRILPGLLGRTPGEIARLVAGDLERYPFVVSAIHEALDDLAEAPTLYGDHPPAAVELLGTVNTLELNEAPAAAVDLVVQGYRTLKVKVGYEPLADAARVAAIADAVEGRAVLRMDANQGYDLGQALDFARRVPLGAVEVFEQPVPASRWDLVAAIAGERILPLMLDESIYGSADIERAASIDGITAVKLKMSKSGGPGALAEQVALARRLGLDVVIGNGVASDLGCYHEALCYGRLGLDAAAEMNGFLKTVDSLLTAPLIVDGPLLRVPEPARTAVDRDRVVALADESLDFDLT